MIVRILGETQYDVAEEHRGALDALDNTLVQAVEANDETAFESVLLALATEVRRLGEPVADDTFTPSELVVPFVDATLEETKRLLTDAAPSDEQ